MGGCYDFIIKPIKIIQSEYCQLFFKMFQWYFAVEMLAFLRTGEQRCQSSDRAQTRDSVFNLFNFLNKWQRTLGLLTGQRNAQLYCSVIMYDSQV